MRATAREPPLTPMTLAVTIHSNRLVTRGGAGSGHFGHSGRPGERGGSAAGEGGAAGPAKGRTGTARVSVRGKNYRGNPGWLISGRDAGGRQVSIFEENENQARAYAQNIKAGREYNEGRPVDTALKDAKGRSGADLRIVPGNKSGTATLMLGEDRTLMADREPNQLSMELDAKVYDPWVRDLTGSNRRYRMPSPSEL